MSNPNKRKQLYNRSTTNGKTKWVKVEGATLTEGFKDIYGNVIELTDWRELYPNQIFENPRSYARVDKRHRRID